MRLRLNHLSVIPAVLVIMGTAGSNDLVAQSSADMSARGHVDIEVDGVSIERYSFTAQRDGEGTEAKGQFQLFRNVGTEDEVRAHGEVTCMTVFPDGSAAIGGVITNREPALAENQPAGLLWTVRDNGEGRNVQDGGTLMFLEAPDFLIDAHCQFNILGGSIPPLPSARGNVQVSSR